MKKLFLIICLTGLVSVAYAAIDLSKWSWQRPIDLNGKYPAIPALQGGVKGYNNKETPHRKAPPFRAESFTKSKGFVRLTIPPEVFHESRVTLDDLRVIDTNQKLVPHVIHLGRVKEKMQLEWRDARLLNESFVPWKSVKATADFGKSVEKNQIRINLSGENFRRRALIEGSPDGKTWGTVAEDVWLFDVSLTDQNFKADIIRFPVNNFRYLRLTVYSMPDDPKRIRIESIQSAFQQIQEEKEWVAVPIKQKTFSQDEKNRRTVLELDLGFRNLPVIDLQFESTTPYFYRGYEIYGRNDVREKIQRETETGLHMVEQDVPWRTIDRGVLYRIKEKEKTIESLRVKNINAPYRYLKIYIFNGDNPPLDINNVIVNRHDASLVFQVQEKQKYALIGGNPKAEEADYDLGKSIQGVDEFKLPLVSLGPSQAVPKQEKPLPWTERHSRLIWIVLIVAVVVMIGFILRSLKKLPPPGK